MANKVWCIGVLTASVVFGPTSRDREHGISDWRQESIEVAIRAVHAEMRQAAEALDAAGLFAHVLDTDTPPIIEDGRLALTHATARERTEGGLRGLTGLAYSYDHESITVISPETVLWAADGTASATLADGRQITSPFAETVLFVMREGKWRVLHAHRSTPDQ